MVLVDDFEVRMRAHVYFLALVIKVGTPGNLLKILTSVFSRSKNIPVRSTLDQVIGLSALESNLGSRSSRGIRCSQTPHEFDDPLQGATVILVVLKQCDLGVCGFVRVPAISPHDALESCGVFICTLRPKKATNVFKAIRKSWEVEVGMDH